MAASPATELCTVFCDHTAALESYLLRATGSAEDAADIAQDVYLRLVNLTDLQLIRQPRAFMLQVATNLLRDRARRQIVRQTRQHVPIEGMEISEIKPSAEEQLIARQRLGIFEAAVEHLPAEQRTAFILHRFREYDQSQIAQEMHISIRKVQKLIRAATAQLRATLLKDSDPLV